MSYHPCGRAYLYRNRKEFELCKPESLSNGPPFYLYTHTSTRTPARESQFLSQKFHCWFWGLHSTISCIPSSEWPPVTCQQQHCDKPYSNSVVASLHGRCHQTASWIVSSMAAPAAPGSQARYTSYSLSGCPQLLLEAWVCAPHIDLCAACCCNRMPALLLFGLLPSSLPPNAVSIPLCQEHYLQRSN